MAELQVDPQPDGAARHPTMAHRSLLANIDNYADTASDHEDSEDELNGHVEDDHITEAATAIGVSMSRAQTRMKSVSTPAAEKARMLDEPHSYFGLSQTQTDQDRRDTGHSARNNQGSVSSKAESTHSTRFGRLRSGSGSSLTDVLRRTGSKKGSRQRSGSASGAILGGLKKMLPDLTKPIKDDTSSPSSLTHSPQTQSPKSSASSFTPDPTLVKVDGHLQVPNQRRATLGMDGHSSATDLKRLSTRRPDSLRRSTSETSLYLRHAITGASAFDDITAFGEVGDMPNSRLKAITDSLADSSLRMPKLPTMHFGSPRGSVKDLSADSPTTRENTEFNAGVARDDKLDSMAEPHPLVHQGTLHPASNKNHPILNDALARAKGHIVLLGGYRGSVLRSADAPHQQLWAPIKIGLNLRKVDLEVGLTREDEEKMEEKIIPDGMLSHIGPIDISRRLFKRIGKSANVTSKELKLHDYGYDWRLSPHLLSRKLIEYLETLECNQPGTEPEKRGALVVAHSLGGLITRHAVNQRPDLFSGVVYCGVPQHCVNILGPLRNGDDVLISSKILTAQVNFTLRTSYALLPDDGRCFINKETGERYDVDFFDPENWDKFRLSPCIKAALPPPTVKRKGSIVGSITGSISHFTPSLPTKRPSWLPGNNSESSLNKTNTMTTTSSNTSNNTTTPVTSSTSATSSSNSPSLVAHDMKVKAAHARDKVEDKARQIPDQISTDIPNTLEPTTMKTSSSSTTHKPNIATACTIPHDTAYEYLSRTLSEIKQFKSELAHNPTHQSNNAYPPTALIFGRTVPTVYGAKVTSQKHIQFSDAYDDLAFAAGDGVVLASAAQLPAGYRCVRGGRVESDRGHVGILGDLEGMGQCIGAVIEGRRRGIGLGRHLSPDKETCSTSSGGVEESRKVGWRSSTYGDGNGGGISGRLHKSNNRKGRVKDNEDGFVDDGDDDDHVGHIDDGKENGGGGNVGSGPNVLGTGITASP